MIDGWGEGLELALRGDALRGWPLSSGAGFGENLASK